MRLPLLTFVLGTVIGIATHSFFTAHLQKLVTALSPGAPEQKSVLQSVPVPAKPFTPVPAEKILSRLKKDFGEAVVVVVANESYDDRHKLIRVEVLEVWKGPTDLVGKTMDAPLLPPLSYLHAKGVVRVLKFMPMTPHLGTSKTVRLSGDALGMNPAVTVETLKEALMIHASDPQA